MADTSVEQVLSLAQDFIGDSNGEITQTLLSYFGVAYSELRNLSLKINAPPIVREAFFVLPAYTNILFPSQLGVSDFAQPQQLWERGAIEGIEVTSVTDGTPIEVTTASPVVLASNNQVQLNGITGAPSWINRNWFVTLTGANTFTLNGSYQIESGFGTITPGAGENWTAQTSQQKFIPMSTIDYRPPGNTVTETLGSWWWEDNALNFKGATIPRQIWIEYIADDSAPEVGTIGLYQGRELQFLAMATAARFETSARQMPAGPAHMLAAYGPSGQADGSGGLLRDLIVPTLCQMQQLPRRSGYFRPRRRFNGVAY